MFPGQITLILAFGAFFLISNGHLIDFNLGTLQNKMNEKLKEHGNSASVNRDNDQKLTK